MKKSKSTKQRCRVIFISLLTIFLCQHEDANARTLVWKPVTTNNVDQEFISIAANPLNPNAIFAATQNTLITSEDSGNSWKSLYELPGTTKINQIAPHPAEPDTLFLATTNGLYGSFDAGNHYWSVLFNGIGEGQQDCRFVIFYPTATQTIVLATKESLFLSKDNGQVWHRLNAPQIITPIKQLVFNPKEPGQLYIVTTSELWVGDVTEQHWRRLFRLPGAEESGVGEPALLETNEIGEDYGFPYHLSALIFHPAQPSTLYLGSTRGLFTSSDQGLTWHQAPQEGILSKAIQQLIITEIDDQLLFAATSQGVAQFDIHNQSWNTIVEGLLIPSVNDIAYEIGSNTLWAATKTGLYRLGTSNQTLPLKPIPPIDELLQHYHHEPTIVQVQEATIFYSETHPGKIKWWRRSAALKALLPSIDIGLDRDRSQNIRVDEGSFPKFQIIETEEKDVGLDFSIEWDLSELIWNNDQLSIDSRSRLMVQLREDLVDRVTRAYFERRRLQVMSLIYKESIEPATQMERLDKQLRIQELTGMIDGLTGGYFSKQLKIRRMQ